MVFIKIWSGRRREKIKRIFVMNERWRFFMLQNCCYTTTDWLLKVQSILYANFYLSLRCEWNESFFYKKWGNAKVEKSICRCCGGGKIYLIFDFPRLCLHFPSQMMPMLFTHDMLMRERLFYVHISNHIQIMKIHIANSAI